MTTVFFSFAAPFANETARSDPKCYYMGLTLLYIQMNRNVKQHQRSHFPPTEGEKGTAKERVESNEEGMEALPS